MQWLLLSHQWSQITLGAHSSSCTAVCQWGVNVTPLLTNYRTYTYIIPPDETETVGVIDHLPSWCTPNQ